MTVVHFNVNVFAYLTSAVTMLNIPLCYVLSVNYDHVYPFLPFLSEVGSLPPGSCVYSLVYTFTTSFLFIIVWLNHSAVENFIKMNHQGDKVLLAVNTISFWCGAFAGINMFYVANIQQTSMLHAHGIAASNFFACIMLHMFVESYLTYKLQLNSSWKSWAQMRLTLAVINTTIGVIGGAAAMYAQLFAFKTGIEMIYFTPENEGYVVHTVAAIIEWLGCIIYFSFFALNFEDKSPLVIHLPKVIFNTNCKEKLANSEKSKK